VSKARLVITAVVIEGRPQADVARSYGVSKGWVSKLVARYRAEGDTAFVPRSRRPKTSPTAIPESTVELIVALRRQLSAQGLDAGADTIGWHLEHHHQLRVSRATIDRTLRRHGLIKPTPAKRPRSSYVRFQAEQPNEMWQADFTHYPLTSGDDTEILSWLDDHARHALSVTAHPRVTGPVVVDTFRTAIALHGAPASTLTDIHPESCPAGPRSGQLTGRGSRGRRPPVCRYEPIEALGTSCLLIAAPGGAHAVEVDGPVRNLATHPAGAPGGDP
jgi:transposase